MCPLRQRCEYDLFRFFMIFFLWLQSFFWVSLNHRRCCHFTGGCFGTCVANASPCVSVCVSLQMKSTEVDQGLFTDSYCKVCSAQLISESQRVAHYEVETPTHITSHSPPPCAAPTPFMLNERPFVLCPRRRHADVSHLSPAADAPSIHT